MTVAKIKAATEVGMAAYKNHMKEIPATKRVSKIKNRITGSFLMIAACGAAYLAWPWFVVLPVFGAGAHLFDKDATIATVKFVVATIREVKNI